MTRTQDSFSPVRDYDEKQTCFEGDVTPLIPQTTTKASGDRQRTSVYLKKPAPLRQLQHIYTHTQRQTGVRYTGTHTHTHTFKPTPPAHSQHCISTSTRGAYSSNPPGRLMAHTLTHDNALIFIFSLSSLTALLGAQTERCGEIH